MNLEKSNRLRHLIIGSSGQVGEFLVKTISKNNEEVISTYNKTNIYNNNHSHPGKLFKLDITDSKAVERLVAEINADVIYIPAANTNVDYCELNQEETNKTNLGGIINIINSINNLKLKNKSKKEPLLVFYSTDYVFDGLKGLYSEKDITNPINAYGMQKQLAEQIIQAESKHYIIIRTTGIFGPESQGKNFVSRLVKNLRDKKEATISDDEFGTPTYAPDLADATLKLVNNIGYGLRNETNNIVNIAGRDYLSRYQFALNIAKTFNCDQNLIIPIKSETLNRPAKRPLLGGLDIDLAESLIGRKLMSQFDGLMDMKKYL